MLVMRTPGRVKRHGIALLRVFLPIALTMRPTGAYLGSLGTGNVTPGMSPAILSAVTRPHLLSPVSASFLMVH